MNGTYLEILMTMSDFEINETVRILALNELNNQVETIRKVVKLI